MLYKNYVYYTLTYDDINTIKKEYDGDRIFQHQDKNRKREVTHILKPTDISLSAIKYMSDGIFYINTGGCISRFMISHSYTGHTMATKEQKEMFLRKMNNY